MRSVMALVLLMCAAACGESATTEPGDATSAALHISGWVTRDGQPLTGRVVLRRDYCRYYNGLICGSYVTETLASSVISDGYYEIDTVVYCKPRLYLRLQTHELAHGYHASVSCTSTPQTHSWNFD